MRPIFLLIMILVVFISGCNGPVVTDGLSVNVETNPSTIFADYATSVYVDVENDDTKTIRDVQIDVYYTGRLEKLNPCIATKDELEPGEFLSLSSCELQAPSSEEMVSSTVKNDVGVRVNFTTILSAFQLVELIDESGYEVQVAAGDWQTKPKTYTHSDKNLELEVEFSDELPIIVRRDKKALVYFILSNTGGGYFNRGRFSLQDSRNVMDCDDFHVYIKDNNFPRIACELNLPENITYLSNYEVIVNITYDYEIRKDTSVTIVR